MDPFYQRDDANDLPAAIARRDFSGSGLVDRTVGERIALNVRHPRVLTRRFWSKALQAKLSDAALRDVEAYQARANPDVSAA